MAVILYVTMPVAGVAPADVASAKALYKFQVAVTSALARALNLYAAGGSVTAPAVASSSGGRRLYDGEAEGEGDLGGRWRRLLAAATTPTSVAVTYAGNSAFVCVNVATWP